MSDHNTGASDLGATPEPVASAARLSLGAALLMTLLALGVGEFVSEDSSLNASRAACLAGVFVFFLFVPQYKLLTGRVVWAWLRVVLAVATTAGMFLLLSGATGAEWTFYFSWPAIPWLVIVSVWGYRLRPSNAVELVGSQSVMGAAQLS